MFADKNERWIAAYAKPRKERRPRSKSPDALKFNRTTIDENYFVDNVIDMYMAFFIVTLACQHASAQSYFPYIIPTMSRTNESGSRRSRKTNNLYANPTA